MEGEFVCLALPVPKRRCQQRGPGWCFAPQLGPVTTTGSTRVPSMPAQAQGGSARHPPAALGARLAAERPSGGLGPWPSHGHGGASPGTARGNCAAPAPAGWREPARSRGREHAACSSCQILPAPHAATVGKLPVPAPLRLPGAWGLPLPLFRLHSPSGISGTPLSAGKLQ